MSQKDRERMIARYTGGRMSPEEERRFLGLVESDPELRRAIETERTIDRTLRRDRDALPLTGAETRSQVLAMLGALEPAPVVTMSAGVGIGTIALIVAGLGLTVGALFLIAPRETAIENAPPRPAATAVEIRHQALQPPKHPSPSTTMEEGTEANAVGGEHPEAVEPRPAQPHGLPLKRRVETAGSAAAPSKVASPISAEPALPTAPRITDTTAPSLVIHPTRTAPPPSRVSDSTRIDITIDLDRMKRRPRQP